MLSLVDHGLLGKKRDICTPLIPRSALVSSADPPLLYFPRHKTFKIINTNQNRIKMDAGLGIGPGAIGMTGYDQYASQNQLDRSAATKTGHRDATALAHLSHTLYIPRHDDGAAHLAIRDISSQYAAAAGNLAIGSSQYVVTLGLMPKPRSDATDSASFPVSYEVNFNSLGVGEAVLRSVRSHTA